MTGRDSRPPCTQCGAPLALSPGARTIACAYCHREQENPVPFEPGQEVLAPHLIGMKLVQVVASRGPDSIELSDGSALRLEDIVPVVRLAHLEPGMEVFVEEMGRWKASHVRRVEGSVVQVASPTPGFRDPFFDRRVGHQQTRVHLDSSRRHRRTRSAALLARVFDDPFGSAFSIVWIGSWVVFALVALWIASLFVRALFF